MQVQMCKCICVRACVNWPGTDRALSRNFLPDRYCQSTWTVAGMVKLLLGTKPPIFLPRCTVSSSFWHGAHYDVLNFARTPVGTHPTGGLAKPRAPQKGPPALLWGPKGPILCLPLQAACRCRLGLRWLQPPPLYENTRVIVSTLTPLMLRVLTLWTLAGGFFNWLARTH